MRPHRWQPTRLHQLLEVQDYTGQAEALVGWRDPFYALKTGFRGLSPFSRVWGPICFLARFPRFTYEVGETYQATLQIRNLTEKPLEAGTARCRLGDSRPADNQRNMS